MGASGVHIPKVVHFEIQADDPRKAIDFYEEVFGWEFSRYEGPTEYWTIRTGGEAEFGIHGGLARRGTGSDPYNVIDVRDLDGAIARVRAAGGTIITPPRDIPGVGRYAAFRDPAGNEFGMLQYL